MITLKSPREIEMMNESGELLADVHRHLRDFIKPGITSMDIENFVRNFIESHGGVAAQIGFEGYEYATCCSINDEICHGFPRKKPLKNGDLIKVDMCVEYKGAMSDSCWSYAVGEVSPEIKRLMEVTKKRCTWELNKHKLEIVSGILVMQSRPTLKEKASQWCATL